MKRIKHLLLMLIVLLSIVMCGCSNSKEIKPVLNYEQPIDTMISSIQNSDNESYLNCYTQGARDKYLNSENYNSRLTDLMVPKKDSKSIRLGEEVLSSTELSKDAIKQLQKEYTEKYKLRIDILKSYKLTVEISTYQGKTQMFDIKEITVINTKSGWLIFDDVIENLNLTKKQNS